MARHNARNAGIMLIIIIALGGVAFMFGGMGSLFTAGIPTPQGVQIQSCSNVAILGQNQNNFSGSYIFCQMLLNGAFQPFASSASSFAQNINNASWVGNQQVDSISLRSVRNGADYFTNGNAGSVVLNVYSTAPYQGSFSFTDCNNIKQIVQGSASTNGWGCAVTGNNQQGASSYAAACKTAASSTLPNGDTQIGVPVMAGGSSSAQCWQVTRHKWGQVYQLGQPQLNTTVQVTMNGQTFTLSQKNTQYLAKNASGKIAYGGYLLPVQSGGTYFGPPQDIGVLYVPNNASPSVLLQDSALSNLLGAATSQNQSLMNSIVGKANVWQCGTVGFLTAYCPSLVYMGPLPYNVGAVNMTTTLLGINNAASSILYIQPKDTVAGLSNASIRSVTGGLVVQLNDPAYQYIRPMVELVSSASFFGFSLAASSFGFTDASPKVAFISGSTGTLTLHVQNNGQAAAAAIVGVTQAPSSFSISSQQTTQLIQPGQAVPVTFTVNGRFPNNSTNMTFGMTFTVCDAATQTHCKSITVLGTYEPQCSSGSQLVNGQCQPIGVITVPTTTVCSGPSCNVTTTMQPITCQPPSVFNQTLYNEHVQPPCWIPPGGGLTFGELALMVLGICAAAGTGIYAYRRSRR